MVLTQRLVNFPISCFELMIAEKLNGFDGASNSKRLLKIAIQ